ncbi:unnamed protein product [Fraxinus pennsylvanica]|uniref:Uncharacterized protein n=1 Tax=Fraxinus pennsylvanica TaxID=56036 RepID=A0AAD1ZIJ4_9LAMI|nr:unnamed protein product [Fraxinus pennsylvanica]
MVPPSHFMPPFKWMEAWCLHPLGSCLHPLPPSKGPTQFSLLSSPRISIPPKSPPLFYPPAPLPPVSKSSRKAYTFSTTRSATSSSPTTRTSSTISPPSRPLNLPSPLSAPRTIRFIGKIEICRCLLRCGKD